MLHIIISETNLLNAIYIQNFMRRKILHVASLHFLPEFQHNNIRDFQLMLLYETSPEVILCLPRLSSYSFFSAVGIRRYWQFTEITKTAMN